jgi:hypothetical protein
MPLSYRSKRRMVSRGRIPGRQLTELELRHLRLLIEMRSEAQGLMVLLDTRLEDFVLQCRESGASARGMADALGVGSSTIQHWTTNGKRRRDG